MTDTKIISFYLPQFHCIPENDKFWGKGFTDWIGVKKSLPIYEGHNQPRVPLNDNYYDLSQKENIAWQVKLAREYGIYGFGVYHYWFNNEQNLLTKPAEIMRDNDDIDINYCFVWDNGNWIRSWSGLKVKGNFWGATNVKQDKNASPILVEYILGGEKDWENHYRYVASHFKSSKYIKINGRPVFCIYNSTSNIYNMCRYWDKLAKADGFEGMYFLFNCKNKDIPSDFCSYVYEPSYSSILSKESYFSKIKKHLRWLLPHKNMKPIYFDYNTVWHDVIDFAESNKDKSLFYCAFVDYDDTPRRGNAAKIYKGATPALFEKYFSQLMKICREKDKEYLFLSAWNEWGEGMYLEPDVTNGYTYLEAVKKALNSAVND